MTQVTDFEMFAGDTKALVVSVTDDEGDAVSIVGADVVWQLATKRWKRERKAAIAAGTSPLPQPILNKTTDDDITITNGAGGVFTVTLNPLDTIELSGGYYHEAEVTLNDGTVATVLTGIVTIKENLINPGGS